MARTVAGHVAFPVAPMHWLSSEHGDTTQSRHVGIGWHWDRTIGTPHVCRAQEVLNTGHAYVTNSVRAMKTLQLILQSSKCDVLERCGQQAADPHSALLSQLV